MGTVIAILGILKSAFSAVLALLAKVPWQFWACLLIFLAGGWLFHGGSCKDFACKRTPKPPRVVTDGPYNVVSCPTGASIEVQVTKRRTAVVALQYVQAHATGEMATASAEHLREIAGATVTLQWERHGLFRGTADTDEEAMSCRRRLDEEEVGDEAAETRPPHEDGKPWPDCPICKGTGNDVIDGTKMASAVMAIWMDGHLPKCPTCREARTDSYERLSAYCTETQAKWAAIEAKFNDFKSYSQPCMCIGTRTEERPEARVPAVAIVTGASGIDVGFDQVNNGYADCTADAPALYQEAKRQAKKSKSGIWSTK